MEPDDSSRVVESADAAAFLTDPARARFLLPFLARERTLSAVAAELGVPVGTVLYRAQQMVALKLLVVSREVPRPGRAIKQYRSSADAYFVPFDLMPFETVEAQISGLEQRSQQQFTWALARVLRQRRAAQTWGTRIYRDPQGSPTMTSAPAPGETTPWPEPDTAMFSTWSTLRLTSEEAQVISQQLQALRNTITDRVSTGRDQYMIHLGFISLTGSDEP